MSAQSINDIEIQAINDLCRRGADYMESTRSDRVFLLTTRRRGDNVFAATEPRGTLMPLAEMSALANARKTLDVNDICLSLQRVTLDSIAAATDGFSDRFALMAELRAAIAHRPDILVAYIVVHANYGPARDMTIFVGGDCYRDQESVGHAVNRVRGLAGAMLRKAVMVFPNDPALHGGKKGEWLVVRRDGTRIDGLSEKARAALGSTIIADTMRFLNTIRIRHAIVDGVLESLEDFSDHAFARSDTASPDTLSGKYWRDLTQVWKERDHPLDMATCLPEHLGGPAMESKEPTARGAVTSAMELIKRRWPDTDLNDVHVLVEGLGGVGQIALGMFEASGIPSTNLHGFDVAGEPVQKMSARFDGVFRALGAEDFYNSQVLPQISDNGQNKLVWFNCSVGDSTTPEQIQTLLENGVEIFMGAANNLLQRSTLETSIDAIFNHKDKDPRGCWLWPDEVTSGGGWALAVADVVNRAQSTPGDRRTESVSSEWVFDIINKANSQIIADSFAQADSDSGHDIYVAVNALIDAREAAALAHDQKLDVDGAKLRALARSDKFTLA